MANPIRLTEFLRYVLPHAPGVPDVLAEQYIRMAAIEFCERTKCWRKICHTHLDRKNTVALVAPNYAAIHQIEYASFASESVPKTPLTPTQYSDMGNTERGGQMSEDLRKIRATMPRYLGGEILNCDVPSDADWHENVANLHDAGEGVPKYITQVNPNTVTVFPLSPGYLEVSLFLKPRMGQSLIAGTEDDPIVDEYNMMPDFLLTQWGEPIACGALSKILTLPQKQWTDPKMASYYLSKFERACDSHFAQGIKGQQRAPIRSGFSFL
ncbi:hypothetical protein [Roseinatronobacter sp. NSM]|uniref:hypothetical protein n=1 Tax=Roseinatronobacter sp. NSM TaxID=3457785 RepID=UPI004036FC63